MKKLMIALAAVAFAVVSQAAVANWQIGSFNGPGAGGSGWGEDAIGGAGYLATLLVSDSVTGDATSGYALGTLVAFASGDTLSGDASEIDGGYGWGTTSDSLSDDATYYAQVIVTKGDSTLTSQIVKIETSALSGSADFSFAVYGDLYGVEALPGQSFDTTYGTFTSAGWTGSVVPEPTSGLLMLLGMAGLALRRRRA